MNIEKWLNENDIHEYSVEGEAIKDLAALYEIQTEALLEGIVKAHEAEQQILVDKILELTTSLDELKSRTCEGCNSYAKEDCWEHEADFLNIANKPNDFCCNKWEKKNVSK